MRRLVVCLLLLSVTGAMAKDRGGDFDACTKGQVELGQKAADYHGEARIQRLIAADLKRAHSEEAEGDADECIEALDHAGKLMRGEY